MGQLRVECNLQKAVKRATVENVQRTELKKYIGVLEIINRITS